MKQVALVVFVGALVALGQAQYTDAELWAGAGVKQLVGADWSWSLQWENRWSQNMQWHEQGLVDAALEYRINKHWNVNAQYRFSERQQWDGGYVARRRGALRLLGDWKVGDGKIEARLMGTEDWTPGAVSEGQRIFGPTIRTRIGYGMELWGAVDASASWEVFVRNGGRMSERWQASLSRSISDQLDVEFSYLWGNEWLEPDPWRSHVVRIQVGWKLPDARKLSDLRIPRARYYAQSEVPQDPNRLNRPCPPCALEALKITEVHSQGTPADYIELQNISAAACDLAGWRITEKLDEVGWVFEGRCFEPSMIWLGYSSGRNSFDFGISSAGELLYLVSPDGKIHTAYAILPVRDGRPQGFVKPGLWDFMEPSPGKPNARN